MKKNKNIDLVCKGRSRDGSNPIPGEAVTLIHDIYMNAHEKVIKEVLAQALNREPVIEDVNRLTIFRRRDYPRQYGLAFDDHPLGMVRETEPDYRDRSVNFSLTFYPGEIQFTRHAPKL